MSAAPGRRTPPISDEQAAEAGQQDEGLDGVLAHRRSTSNAIAPPRRSAPGPSGSRSVVVAGVDVDAGDALGVEHLDVAAVVLEGEPEVEARGPAARATVRRLNSRAAA